MVFTYQPRWLTQKHMSLHDRQKKLQYIWTRVSFDAYTNIGGSGITLALIIAIFAFSKIKYSSTIASLVAPMGEFNINVPVTFSILIVLNPFYVLPWLTTHQLWQQ